MLDLDRLKHGDTVYRFTKDGFLMWCDIIQYPKSENGFGFIPQDQNWKVFHLLEDDMEKMFHTIEDAEQIAMFEDEGIYK